MKLDEIAGIVDGRVDGDASIEIKGIAKIEDAEEGYLAFLAHPKYTRFLETTRASALIVSQDFPATERTVIRVSNPHYAFLKLLKLFYPAREALEPGIHPTAILGRNTYVGEGGAVGAYVVIGKQCHLGNRVKVYPGVIIGDEVEIGDDSIVYANVSIRERVKIGRNVIVHCGAVIGSDGFGFVKQDGKYHKIPQVGTVVIEDDVEIGANVTIDRATLGATRIGRGTKLDNLIQVAHNVEIGEDTVIAAQTGISGSTKIGKSVVIGGQVGFAGHIEIGDNTTFGAQAGVTKSIPANTVVSGYPARPHMQAKREEALIRKLPELLKRIQKLEKKVQEKEKEKEKDSK